MRLADLIPSETTELRINADVILTIRPLAAAMIQAARMAAFNRADTEDWPEGLDRENEAHRLGLGLSIQEQEIAAFAVVGWTLDDPVTRENVIELLTALPRLGERISNIANPLTLTSSRLAEVDEGNG